MNKIEKVPQGLLHRLMSFSNGSFDQAYENMPNYNLACDLGYELSKRDYEDMLNYAKLVQKEHSLTAETSPRTKKQVKTFRRASSSESHIPIFYAKRKIYFEDLWIKQLREYYESEKRG